MNAPPPHRVVVIGGGFAGIEAVKGVVRARARIEVTLVDRRNYHLFQPLTYQVATGALSPAEIAYPLRAMFKRARNVRVLLAEVTGIDLSQRRVELKQGEMLGYDTLIVAAGSSYSYFGHEEWRHVAPEVKSLESALAVRARIQPAFEAAELCGDERERAALLSFAVVGAGATGVEMAGQIAEIANQTLRGNFRSIDPQQARIVLVEAGDQVLPTFPRSLSAKASRSLERIGVTPIVQRKVVGIDGEGVTMESPDGATHRLAAHTVVWAAGVTASPLATELAAQSGTAADRAGRVTVDGDLTLPGHPEVVALGDMVRVRRADGEIVRLPGVAPVAIQQGRYAAKLVVSRLRGERTQPFRYRDKGDLATIGRAHAVADLRFVRLGGPLAWMVWLVVHLWYLIGFENRLLVVMRWAFSFVTRGRSARLIAGMAT